MRIALPRHDHTNKRGWSRMARREFLAGLLFASPWILGLILFTAYPMLSTLYYSFTEYELPLPPIWIGLDNYIEMFTRDRRFTRALGNTLYLTLIGIPALLVFALVSALLLNLPVRGMALWRTIYVLPTLAPQVVLAILWGWMLNPDLGIVNNLLEFVGIRGPLWFASPDWSKPAIILTQLWAVGSMTIIYLAALQAVPRDLYEAAEIDGAGRWSRFWNVTVPMISPVTLFQLITGIIWSLQYFTQAYVISGMMSGNPGTGYPGGSLLFYGIYLYEEAFISLNMGYASALAWMLFLMSAAATWLLLTASRRWTHYAISG
ncbi:MAG: sugar ABC transporter permease [Chloroflexota bacterium]|nr:sugar ABC transporter permease [Chloroflexota bacterium]